MDGATAPDGMPAATQPRPEPRRTGGLEYVHDGRDRTIN
jgi:hypothetical protein